MKNAAFVIGLSFILSCIFQAGCIDDRGELRPPPRPRGKHVIVQKPEPVKLAWEFVKSNCNAKDENYGVVYWKADGNKYWLSGLQRKKMNKECEYTSTDHNGYMHTIKEYDGFLLRTVSHDYYKMPVDIDFPATMLKTEDGKEYKIITEPGLTIEGNSFPSWEKIGMFGNNGFLFFKGVPADAKRVTLVVHCQVEDQKREFQLTFDRNN